MQKLLNTYTLKCPANFVDHLVERFDLKNDAQLARMLRLGPPAISKLRHGTTPLTAEVMVRIHEAGDIPMREIRAIARVESPRYPEWVDVIGKPDRRGKKNLQAVMSALA